MQTNKKNAKQYKENTTYEENGTEICKEGMMHYCVNPFDCFDYYPIIDENGDLPDFCEVESLEEPVTNDGKKYATKKLHIGAKISFAKVVDAFIAFVYEKTEKCSGYGARIGSSGYGAQIGSSGYRVQIGSSGDLAQISSKGKNAAIAAVGHDSKVKADIGSWICLTEWGEDEEGKPFVLSMKCGKIDGVKLKPDTWYMLKNGEFAEV